MDRGVPGLRWGVERRLEFIEFRLFWEGGINRADIMNQFGVSVPQASKDLSHYQELAPENMRYDRNEKRYLVNPAFRPRFSRPDPDQYFSQLQAIAHNTSRPGETWLSHPPELGSLPVLHRHIDPDLLSALSRTIREGQAVEILYQSMNPGRPEPVWRGISPHAFGNDGFRWHVRAFCHLDRKFKDFLLSRCLGHRTGGEPQARPCDDRDWHTFVEVTLQPNPKLSASQQRVIAHDFFMENNKLELSIRKSLLYYFEKRLRLDVAEILDNPREAPVVIANRPAFDRALAETA